MTTSERQAKIVLQAESICTVQEATLYPHEVANVLKVILFRPTPETVEQLQNTDKDTVFQGMDLVDKWDDGVDSTHSSLRAYTFLGVNPQDGHKQHTWIARFRM